MRSAASTGIVVIVIAADCHRIRGASDILLARHARGRRRHRIPGGALHQHGQRHPRRRHGGVRGTRGGRRVGVLLQVHGHLLADAIHQHPLPVPHRLGVFRRAVSVSGSVSDHAAGAGHGPHRKRARPESVCAADAPGQLAGVCLVGDTGMHSERVPSVCAVGVGVHCNDDGVGRGVGARMSQLERGVRAGHHPVPAGQLSVHLDGVGVQHRVSVSALAVEQPSVGGVGGIADRCVQRADAVGAAAAGQVVPPVPAVDGVSRDAATDGAGERGDIAGDRVAADTAVLSVRPSESVSAAAAFTTPDSGCRWRRPPGARRRCCCDTCCRCRARCIGRRRAHPPRWPR
eukprot:ctg_2065.g478